MYYSGIPLAAPQGVEALGIAYFVTNEVQAVVPGGPAAGTDIRPGDRITAAEIQLPNDKDGKSVKPVTVPLGDEAQNWSALVDDMQFAAPETKVTFTVSGPKGEGGRELTITPTVVENASLPAAVSSLSRSSEFVKPPRLPINSAMVLKKRPNR